MPFAFQLDQATPMLVAFENRSALVTDPQPTIYAQLVAGWVCPECKMIIKAIAGSWSNPKAQWWTYDHYDNQHLHKADNGSMTEVRPTEPKRMPRYRGSFGLDGGYLFSFGHRNILGIESEYSRATVSCGLGVSRRVGIHSGVRNMRYATRDANETLATGLEAYGPSALMRLIPDVMGQREPIVASTAQATSEWDSARSGYSDEERARSWTNFVPRLIA